MENKKIALQSNKPSLGRTPVSSRKPYLTLSDDELASVSGGDFDGSTYSFSAGDAFKNGNYIFVVRENKSNVSGNTQIAVDKYNNNGLDQPDYSSGQKAYKSARILNGYESVSRISNYTPLV